ncbi:RHS repeat-associated core domain-containing protein [Chryseobacterium shandongense]|uniref:RHS repeat-associated core domain-containing protein n=2 Tax=Chryseobacterium shandongense TaxID=1493872 RepID=A0AAD0Y9J5_9FLAO|nr:RHS repeat-associated core domain-containing protein [Chryseobacterium shandongense]AZA94849.1 RHS repeat-associated core domain-containing protein [Chryseobacterium shandongense]
MEMCLHPMNTTTNTKNNRMKKTAFLYFLFVVQLVLGQTPTASENYIYTKQYLSADGSKKAETIQYFDGLGRPKQMISVKATPQGKDLVVPFEYDLLGRQSREILPVPMTTTNLGIQTVSEATANSYYGVANAYTEKKMEASPLARIQEVANPGTAWAMSTGHTRKLVQDVNQGDQVKKYSVTNGWNQKTTLLPIPTVSFYGDSQLGKSTVEDEDGNKTIEFTDSLGRTVLVRKVLSANVFADTYYVYNDYGHLLYVISPEADKTISKNGNTVTQNILDNLCYQYRYDSKNRLVEKQLPGKGKEYMIYDLQGRLVAYQDANQRGEGKWLFTRYDKFGRTVYTGTFLNSGDRLQQQANADAKGLNNEARTTVSFTQNGKEFFYTNTAYPSGTITVLSVNYYDTYPGTRFSNTLIQPTSILGQPTLAGNTAFDANGVKSIRSIKSLPTASMVKNLEDDAWTSTHIWYDTQTRAIGSHTINHLGGYTKTETELDFSGIPLQSKTLHKRLVTDTEKIILETFTYDSQNRLKMHKHKIDSNPEEILAQHEYDELSQLITKKVGGTNAAAPLQTIDYAYNIRGWMTQINDPTNLGTDLFGYKIKFNEVEGLQTPDTSDTDLKVLPKYNGNIAEVDWKSAAQSNETLKRYGYVYDGMNRLLAGFYQNSDNPSLREYYEKATYDLNGNIKTMKRTAQRMGSTALLIDNLTYQYENAGVSNRLQKITDAVTISQGYPYKATPVNIGYDSNGNITAYQDKGISGIQYNILNLPKQITQNSVVTSYTYRADGVKVKKLFGTVETQYLDGFQYKYTEPWEDPNGTMTTAEMKLRIIPTAEGYYDALRKMYFYSYKDHLGNVRLNYADADGNGVVTGDIAVTNCQNTPDGQICDNYIITGETEGVANYYPFGMLHNNTAANFDNAYQYKYNGKELQETGMYDYVARFYMPDIGRWGVMDPLAEVTSHLSPYHYGNNNPLMYNDPTGMLSQSFIDQLQNSPSGTTWYNTGIGFTNNLGASMDYDGNKIRWGEGYTKILMQDDGIAFETRIPEVVMNARGNKYNWNMSLNHEYNSYLLMSKITGTQGEWNYDMNSSNMGQYILNSKASREVAEFEKFLFLEVPISLAGGELFAAGWRAANFGKMGLNLYSKVISSNTNRVFWSGGGDALSAAMEYATTTGGTTLEMTGVGRTLSSIGKGTESILGRDLSWKVMKPLWQVTSKAYATGAKGTANVFINTARYNNGSIWRTLEAPILESNGIGFRYHYVFP